MMNNELNHEVYEDTDIVAGFAKQSELFPAEKTILDKYGPELRDQPVLDLGVGAGRTTSHLLALTQDYHGVDYAATMVHQCQQRFPKVKFSVCDSRDMSAFRDGQFALVFFSFNGMDYVTPSERLVVLKEVWRIVRPGGLFVFSSHNGDRTIHSAFHHSNIEWSAHPVKLLRGWYYYLLGWGYYLRNRKLQVTGSDYAIINDSAHSYRLLTYYISKVNQLKQLVTQGFTDIQMVDKDGAWTDSTVLDRRSPNIYYVARKPA
jgi:ubiquinone/menaquinone biosynthesis C-methylase UbiE